MDATGIAQFGKEYDDGGRPAVGGKTPAREGAQTVVDPVVQPFINPGPAQASIITILTSVRTSANIE